MNAVSTARLWRPLSLLVVLIVLITSHSPAQLDRWRTKLLQRIEIGMTPDEVKDTIGRPDSILAGSPGATSDKMISMPDLRGEERFSTWFYLHEVIFEDELLGGDTTSTINGRTVPNALFEKYKYRTSVYLYNDRLINPDQVIEQDLWRDPNLSIVDNARIEQKVSPPRIIQTPYRPVLSITFDGITRVVSSMNVFFKRDH